MEISLMDTFLYGINFFQKVALDVLEFLSRNDGNYEKMIVHGFSAGGNLWGEILRHWQNDPLKYQAVMDRIVAQVWDSLAGISEVPIGMSKSIFPHNKFMQKSLEKFILNFLNTFDESIMRHYIKSADLFYSGLVKAPALFFVSKTDIVGTEAESRKIADKWIKAGVNVTWKCFDSSPHIGHLLKHRDEYLECLHSHLREVDLLQFGKVVNSKL